MAIRYNSEELQEEIAKAQALGVVDLRKLVATLMTVYYQTSDTLDKALAEIAVLKKESE